MIKDLYTIIVAAVSENGVIGKDGSIPWHLPEDMKHFRDMTKGGPVIMGRKTYESLPESFRPLPGRLNIVLSHQEGYQVEGAHVYNSLENALEDLSEGFPQKKGINYEYAFVIGGEKVYEKALPFADHLELTHVQKNIENGTAYFPKFDENEWIIDHETESKGCKFVSYTRKLE